MQIDAESEPIKTLHAVVHIARVDGDESLCFVTYCRDYKYEIFERNLLGHTACGHVYLNTGST